MSKTGDNTTRPDADVVERTDQEIVEPDLWNVLLHNDHYTTMEFVIEVVQTVFRKSIIEATVIMLDVHRKGVGVAGAYIHDIAQTKAETVHRMARERDFPLRCSVEKA